MKEDVCIDSGHGGKDPGAVSGNIKEKDVVLKIAKSIQILTQREVFLTRHTDTFLPLKNRVEIANRRGSKFFLSIHCNASKNKRAHGMEVWYCKGSKIGKRIAGLFQNRLSLWGSADRGIKEAYGKDKTKIYVLKYTKMPAILLELGFLSNTFDRRKLHCRKWQEKIAKEIAELIDLLSPC